MNKGKVVLILLSILVTGCASNESNVEKSVIEVKENSNSYCTNVDIKYKNWKKIMYKDKDGEIKNYQYYYEVPMIVSMNGFSLPEETNEPITMRIRNNARVEYVDTDKNIDVWLSMRQYTWIQDKGKEKWKKMIKSKTIYVNNIKEEDVENIKHIDMYAYDGEYGGIQYDQNGYVIEFADLNK